MQILVNFEIEVYLAKPSGYNLRSFTKPFSVIDDW